MGVLLFGRVILIGRIAFRLIVRGRLRSLILGGDWEVGLVVGVYEGFLDSGGVGCGRSVAIEPVRCWLREIWRRSAYSY